MNCGISFISHAQYRGMTSPGRANCLGVSDAGHTYSTAPFLSELHLKFEIHIKDNISESINLLMGLGGIIVISKLTCIKEEIAIV